jgi:hypothetical protein
MRKRRFLIGAFAVVTGLLMTGTASAAVTGISYTATVAPKKQSKKTFGPAKIANSLDTFYTAGFAPNATQTVLRFSKDLKFTPGNVARCQLNQINTAPQSTADAVCGRSKIGQGSASINGGILTGRVAAYNGTPSGSSPSVYLHVDVFAGAAYTFSTTLTGVLNTGANTLTVSIPPTGTSITHFDTTINKIKSGKKKGKATYYVMARCKKKKWSNTATTVFSDGSSQSSTSVQKCKQKK